jgi:hypothetical protein
MDVEEINGVLGDEPPQMKGVGQHFQGVFCGQGEGRHDNSLLFKPRNESTALGGHHGMVAGLFQNVAQE